MTREEKKYLKNIGNSILRRREALNLNRAEFAKRIGVSRYHVYRIEDGSHSINIWKLKKISDVLKCTVTELIGED